MLRGPSQKAHRYTIIVCHNGPVHTNFESNHINIMSKNFERVKRKMMADMADTSNHTQMGWAHIMLKAAERCRTDEDQKAFFSYIVNPNDEVDVPEPVFMEVDTTEPVMIDTFQSMSVVDDEKMATVEFENVVHTNGGTTYIASTQVECTS